MNIYAEQGGTYIGNENKSSGLNRWFKETWVNSRGELAYKNASDIYRPTNRIIDKTPATYSQLTQKQIVTARKEKQRHGRANKLIK